DSTVLPWTRLDNTIFDERIQMAVNSYGHDLSMEGQETARHFFRAAFQIRTMALSGQLMIVP
ncbi:MAG: hypothetical protein VX317_06445, partial [Verrucomicrobiota bacterium]|nr:hypothetical protein [Verrucomicrobiota bacterium]